MERAQILARGACRAMPISSRNPQVKHVQALVMVKGAGDNGAPVTLVNHPVRYDGKAASIRLAPQRLGAQTKEVLAELGFARRDCGARPRRRGARG